jgi:hypothetical protein
MSIRNNLEVYKSEEPADQAEAEIHENGSQIAETTRT